MVICVTTKGEQPKNKEENTMKQNILKEAYVKERVIKEAFKISEKQDDNEGMEKARAKFKELNNLIAMEGKAFERVYEFYSESQERGNAYIDINSVI